MGNPLQQCQRERNYGGEGKKGCGWVWGRSLDVETTRRGAEFDSRVRLGEVSTCPRQDWGKFCLTAGDFPRRPLEDPFNPLTGSVIAVAFFGLLRRQEL